MNILDIAIAKQLAGGSGGSGTDNYNDLSNLPKINDTTLSGNKSSSALGLQSEITNDNKLSSDLVDDANKTNKFVTSTEKQTWNSKQNAIDADHKINADYVDDSTSTNKFVTADNKETWNAKQNAIDNSHKLSSDLVDDANHTNKFVTSTEKTTWNNKQNAIDADHKLSSSLVSFTTAEAAALASGIDSAKVSQISTNQTNILYTLDKVGTNCASIDNAKFTAIGEDRYLVIQCGNTLTGNIHIHIDSITSDDTNANTCAYIINYTDGSSSPAHQFSRGVSIDENLNLESNKLRSIQIYPSNTYSNSEADTLTLTNFMVTSKAIWDQYPTFTPAALPNSDLTQLEAEDRASLAEVVDSGAKNLLNGTWVKTEADPITFTTNSNGSISITKSATSASACFVTMANQSLTVGKQYAISDSLSDHTNVIAVLRDSSGSITYGNTDGTPIFTVPTTASTYKYMIRLAATYIGTITVYPMICTKAAFGVSNKFVPYRPNYDLVCESVYKYQDKNFACSESETYEYTGLSVTVPASQVFEISAYNRYGNAPPRGIIIADSNSQSTGAVILGESTGKMSTGDDPKVRSVWCLTSVESVEKTYYIWVKNGNTGSNKVAVAYRRIY